MRIKQGMAGITSKLDVLKDIYNSLLKKQLAVEIDLQANKIMLIKYPATQGLHDQKKMMDAEYEKTKILVRTTMDMILELTKDK